MGTLSAALTMGAFGPSASGAVITTAVGGGVDSGLSENGGGDDSGRGTSTDINARYNNLDKNEMLLLRFDTSTVTKSLVDDVAINMVAFRDSNNNKNLEFYGVNSGVDGLNTFAEDANFSEVPGLEWDDSPLTKGVAASETTLIGTMQLDGTALKGNTITYSSDALTTFVRGLADTDMVTILVTFATTSNGQFRIATKESTSLDGGTPTGNAGDFAPSLSYEIVPEPASLSLLGLAGLALARRRRG